MAMREWLERCDGGGFDRLARSVLSRASGRSMGNGGVALPCGAMAVRIPDDAVACLGSWLMVPALPRPLTEAVARTANASRERGNGDVWLVRHPDGSREAMTPWDAASLLGSPGGYPYAMSPEDRVAVTAGIPCVEVDADEAPRLAA